MKKILEAIKELFPDADISNIGMSTKLGEISGWDSMTAINLVIEIESRFNCSGLSLEFSASQTFGEVCDQLRKKGLDI